MTHSIAEFPGIEEGFLTGYAPGRRLARKILFGKLCQLSEGRLRFVDEEAGIDQVFGEASQPVEGFGGATDGCTVRVHDQRFYPKVLFGGSIGAAEAFMAGHWTADDLTRVLRFFLVNRSTLDSLDSGIGRLMKPAHALFQRLRANSRGGSRRNISAHYDLSNDFFQLFLDSRMMYSSAVFENQEQDLEEAALHKIDRLCRKLELGPEDHLLEIGTGWGGLAVHAAEHYGCRVTTTTISEEQYRVAVARVKEHQLEDRVEVLLRDYRDLEGTYTKLVSVEMIEAVGREYLDTYFRVCSERLAPGGLMAIQAITMADRLFPAYQRSVDFIQRYIFPGSFLPSVGSLAESVASTTDMKMVHLEDIGPHYARTLHLWRDRFFAQLDRVEALGFSERFVRMWDYYLCYCEAGFLERTIGDLQVVLAKPGNRGHWPLGNLDSRAPLFV